MSLTSAYAPTWDTPYRGAPRDTRPAIARGPVPAVLLLVGGILGIAQVALPWAEGSSGLDAARSAMDGTFMDWVSGVGIYIAAAAGLVMLLSGVALFFVPQLRDTSAKAGRWGGIAILAVLLWWVSIGTMQLGDLFGGANFGWYAIVFAGLLGFAGGAIALSSNSTTLDRISFMSIFLGLPLLIFIVFVLSPFAQAVYYSMTDWKGFSADMNFTGMKNYIKLFGDEKFQSAVFNNIKMGIVVPLVTIIFALAVASMVTVGGPSKGPVSGIKGSSFYRVISFFPYAVPAIVIGIIWKNVYDPSSGILNSVLNWIPGLDFTNFAWLAERSTALWVTMFVIIWSFVGFYAILFIASIKGISAEVYEAAKLDGAGRFRTAISITIPLIRDSIQTAYIYIGIAALDGFVYVMALNSSGGPGGTGTLTMSQDLYLTAFTKFQFGYATAMGVVLSIVTLLFATLVFAVNRWTGGRTKKVAK